MLIWILRWGIILECAGAILLSTSLVYLLVRQEMISKVWEFIEHGLRCFLNWVLNTKLYKQMRLRPTRIEDSIGILIRENYIALGVLFALAIAGWFLLLLAVSTRNYGIIVVAIPFAALAGWAFARPYSSQFVKIFMFVFFTFTSPLIYPLLIMSVLLHLTLLTLICSVALLHAFFAPKSVQISMLIVGGFFIALGAGLQLAYTFL